MGIKRCGLFVLSLGVSFIGLSGLLSDKVSAVSVYDDLYQTTDVIHVEWKGYGGQYNCSDTSTIFDIYTIGSFASDDDNWIGASGQFIDEAQASLQHGIDDNSYGISITKQWGNNEQQFTSVATIFWTEDNSLTLDWDMDSNAVTAISSTGNLHYTSFACGKIYQGYDDRLYLNGHDYGGYGVKVSDRNSTEYPSQYTRNYVLKADNINYPEDYDGIPIKDDAIGDQDSEWTPDIKLLQGSDWLVELSDYNFFTFDKVAFTCGEHELAPVINWEVWDITDDENRTLIDTLVFGAPALVKYQAPKIQEDKRYEVVAYYSDCEGYNFTQASTKGFTIRKDGTLNKADYMVVCVREDFPFINLGDCWAELNDFFVVLSFRVPNEDKLAGGVFKDIPNGCRELQVLDVWLFSPNQVVCPQFPSGTRQVITPFITFALGLMAVSFIARRQGIRSLN